MSDCWDPCFKPKIRRKKSCKPRCRCEFCEPTYCVPCSPPPIPFPPPPPVSPLPAFGQFLNSGLLALSLTSFPVGGSGLATLVGLHTSSLLNPPTITFPSADPNAATLGALAALANAAFLFPVPVVGLSSPALTVTLNMVSVTFTPTVAIPALSGYTLYIQLFTLPQGALITSTAFTTIPNSAVAISINSLSGIAVGQQLVGRAYVSATLLSTVQLAAAAYLVGPTTVTVTGVVAITLS